MPHTRHFPFLVLVCLLALTGCETRDVQAPQTAAMKVVVAEATLEEIEEQFRFNATLVAKETVEVRSRVSGYLVGRMFVEGAKVRRGDIIYRLDDRDLQAAYDTAKANVAKAEATWKNDERTKQRYVPLASTGAVSLQERDVALANASESLAAYTSATAEAERAAVTLGYATIIAPITGYITRSNVDVGGYVEAGSALMATIYRTDPIRAEFSITDKEFELYRHLLMERGGGLDSVVFRMEVGDRRWPYQHQGQLETADPVLDSRTNTMGVRVEFPNPENALRPGMYVNVIGVLGARQALTVPEIAIVERDGGKAVFTLDEQSRLVAVPVEIGDLYGEKRVITKGLAPGQKVVVQGLVMAQPGMRVEVVSAGSAAPAGGAAQGLPAS